MALVELGLLGPLRVTDEARELAPGGRRQRRLLARLGIAAGQVVTLDDLEDAVWEDDPPHTARHTTLASSPRASASSTVAPSAVSR